jgi:hypothetical protein
MSYIGTSFKVIKADLLVEMSCRQCGTTDTPLWRYGPEGSKSLCNACGIRWKRANKYRLSGGIRKRKHQSIATLPRRPPTESNNSTFNHFLETVEGIYKCLNHRTNQVDEYEHENHVSGSVLAPASPAITSAYPTDDESIAVHSEAETEADYNGALFLHFISHSPQETAAMHL